MRPQEEGCWARAMYKKPPESEQRGINTSLLPRPLSLALQPFTSASYWPTLPERTLNKGAWEMNVVPYETEQSRRVRNGSESKNYTYIINKCNYICICVFMYIHKHRDRKKIIKQMWKMASTQHYFIYFIHLNTGIYILCVIGKNTLIYW